MSSSFKNFTLINKKILVIFISFIFLNIFSISSSYALKQDIRCNQHNSIKYDKKNIYLCVKNGKALSWKQQTKPKSIKELNPLTSWFFAYQNIKQNKLSKCNDNFDTFISQNISYEKKQNILEQVLIGCQFWSGVGLSTNTTVLIATEKDMQFWKTELNKISQHDGAIRYSMIENSYKSFGSLNNSASAGITSDKKSYMTFEYGSGITLSDIKTNQYQTGIHEYTHTVQWALGGIGDIWAMEGQAEFTGLALSKSTPQEYYDYRNFRIKNQLNSANQQNINNTDKIVQSLYDQSNNSFYSFGTLSWEALVSIYGNEKIFNYMKLIKNGENANIAFAQTFNYTQQDFIKNISSYLLKCRLQLV